jgi:hypothetical protein
MIDPISLISFAPSILQGAGAIGQLIAGNKLAKNNERPMYEIPAAQQEALANARNLSYDRQLAGQDAMEAGLDEQLANTNAEIQNTASSSTDALGALIGANANRMRSQTALDTEAARDYERRQMALRGELGQMASFEDKKWQLNELNPFMDKAAASSALTGSGLQNLFGAANSAVGMGLYQKELKKLGEKPKAGGPLLAQAGTSNTENPEFKTSSFSAGTQDFFKAMDALKFNPTLRINPFEEQAKWSGAPSFEPQPSYSSQGGKDFYNPFAE